MHLDPKRSLDHGPKYILLSEIPPACKSALWYIWHILIYIKGNLRVVHLRR